MIDFVGHSFPSAFNLNQGLPGQMRKIEHRGGQDHEQDQEGYERGKLNLQTEPHIPSTCCGEFSG